MADKVARTHTHGSNRAKAREVSERKAVFKSVLDSPFRIPWPSVPLNLQNTILAMLISLLDGIAEFQQHHRHESRKRKREIRQNEQSSSKRIKSTGAENAAAASEMEVKAAHPDFSTEIPKRPPILDHIAVGINEVTKRLEDQTRIARTRIIAAHKVSLNQPDPTNNPLKVILVCRADINPLLLVDHLPHLVAAYNSSQAQEILKLVSLPKDAEVTLAKVLGLHRAAIIGLDSHCPGLETVLPLLENVPTLKATWLAPNISHTLVPTHIKQVKTSMPKDMRAAKKRRVDGKAAAKQRRQEAQKVNLTSHK